MSNESNITSAPRHTTAREFLAILFRRKALVLGLFAVTTITVQIVTLLTGDQEFDSAKTLSAFALGLVLFVATLLLNILALHILRTYREKYD